MGAAINSCGEGSLMSSVGVCGSVRGGYLYAPGIIGLVGGQFADHISSRNWGWA